MIKDIKDICLVVQARLGSTRVPNKMLRPFAGTTLVDILFSKLKSSKVIPLENIYFSAYEEELKDTARNHNINIFHRSEDSANEEKNPLKIWEWHDKLPYKYIIMVSACNPLLKVDTIDKFISDFMSSDKEGSFSVFEKKTYYWDKNNIMITNWGDSKVMNTKYVEPVYEAAHCLYASRLDIIKDGYFMDTHSPIQPNLFKVSELESFDIDYEWQFKVGEVLYEEFN
tara:strand:- start:2170 stop:2850 length:681 start_codon:yes stop_codon:yes gene_type:complete